MKKRLVILIITIATAGFFISNLAAFSGQIEIEKIKLTDKDIPDGFRYGIIPDFASGLLKANPWVLDQNAMKKLTHRIYPGAEYAKISSIHMTILASNENPYGDDIVCYIFTFKDQESAKTETEKLNEYVSYNSDRAITLEKENIAIFLFVDNIKDYPYIKTLSETMRARLDSL